MYCGLPSLLSLNVRNISIMSIKQRLSGCKQSDWFIFFVSLSLTAILGVIVVGSSLANIPILFAASVILLFVSLIPLWFGILQGILGKEKTSPAINIVLGIISLILLSMVFFWALSTIAVTDSSSWMKEGTTAVFAGIIGAIAYDIITKPYRDHQNIKANSEIADGESKITAPINADSMEPIPDEASKHDDQLSVLKEICDTLKEANKENRELNYTMLIFTWVVAVATLLIIGNDIWNIYGWPLPFLWISILVLIIGGCCSYIACT